MNQNLTRYTAPKQHSHKTNITRGALSHTGEKMKALSVHVKKFDIDRFILRRPPAEQKESEATGIRIKFSYKYDNGEEAPCVLVADRITITFGITPPYVTKGTPPKPGWDICFGPRKVRRDKQDPSKFYCDQPTSQFKYRPESVEAFYAVLHAIDEKTKAFLSEHYAGFFRSFTSAVRTQRPKPGKKMITENWCVHAHMNTDMADKNKIRSTLADRLGPVRDQDAFIKKSKMAEVVPYICVASCFMNSTGDASQQLRVNHLLMLSDGTDPAEKSTTIVYENEDVDYGEDLGEDPPSKRQKQPENSESEGEEEE